MPTQPEFDGSQELTAQVLNRLLDDLWAAEHIEVTAPLEKFHAGSGGVAIRLNLDAFANATIPQAATATDDELAPFWASISRVRTSEGDGFGGIYSWDKIIPAKYGTWVIVGSSDDPNGKKLHGGDIDKVTHLPIRPAFDFNRDFLLDKGCFSLLYPIIRNPEWNNTLCYFFDNCCSSKYTTPANEFIHFIDSARCHDNGTLPSTATFTVVSCSQCLNGVSISLTLSGNIYTGSYSSGSCTVDVVFDWTPYVVGTPDPLIPGHYVQQNYATLSVTVCALAIAGPIGYFANVLVGPCPRINSFFGSLGTSTNFFGNPYPGDCCCGPTSGGSFPVASSASLCVLPCTANPTTNPDPPPVAHPATDPLSGISFFAVINFTLTLP